VYLPQVPIRRFVQVPARNAEHVATNREVAPGFSVRADSDVHGYGTGLFGRNSIMMPPVSVEDRIEGLLVSQDPVQRREGVLTLLRLRHPQAADLLRTIVEKDPAPVVRHVARKALAFLEHGPGSLQGAPQEDAPVLHPALADLESIRPAARSAALDKLIGTGDRRLVGRLARLLPLEPDAPLRLKILDFFEGCGRRSELSSLAPALNDRDTAVRRRALEVAVAIGGEDALPYVFHALQDGDAPVRGVAKSVLRKIPKTTIREVLSRMMKAGEVWQRHAGIKSLVQVKDPEIVVTLVAAMKSADPVLRRWSAKALRTWRKKGDDRARRALEEEHAGRASSRVQGEAVPGGGSQPPDDRTVDLPPPAPGSGVPIGVPEPDHVALSMDTSDSHPMDDFRDPYRGPGGIDDANPKVRIRALTAIADRRDSEATDSVKLRLDQEPNIYVTSKVLITLGWIGSDQDVSCITSWLDHDDGRVVASAIEALEDLGDRTSAGRVRALAGYKDPRIRANAILFLSRLMGEDVGERILTLLTGRTAREKLSGLFVVNQLSDTSHMDQIETLLSDVNDDVRTRAFDVLTQLTEGGSSRARAMREMVLLGDVDIKRESVRYTAAGPTKRILAWLIDTSLFGFASLLAVVIAFHIFALQAFLAVSVIAILSLSMGYLLRDAIGGGRGFGKRILGLRVVDMVSNEGISPLGSLVRQAFIGLPFVNLAELVLVHVDEQGKRLADHIIQSMVVDEQRNDLGAMGTVLVGIIYFSVCAAVGVGTMSALIDKPRYRSPLGFTLEVPRGWAFLQVGDRKVSLQRSSLLEGPRFTLNLSAVPRAVAGLIDKGAPDELILQKQARSMGESLRDTIQQTPQVEIRSLDVSAGPPVGGRPSHQFEIVLAHEGASRSRRGMVSFHGDWMFVVLVDYEDPADRDRYESEILTVLEGLSGLGSDRPVGAPGRSP